MSHQTSGQAKRASLAGAWILTLAVGLLALAGCGSSSKSTSSAAPTPASPPAATTSSGTSSTPAPASGSGEAQTLTLSADPGGQLKYVPSSLAAKAGKVAIDFKNSSPVEHDVTVTSPSGAVLGATPIFQGAAKTLSLNLKPGTYTFYCSVPGHRQAGMEGTLTVK